MEQGLGTSVPAARSTETPFETTIDDVYGHPDLLSGRSLAEVRGAIGESSGWVHAVMRHSTTNPGGGWVFRELNPSGTDFSGRLIEFHPGGSRHHFGGSPYWKVSGVPNRKPIRFPAK